MLDAPSLFSTVFALVKKVPDCGDLVLDSSFAELMMSLAPQATALQLSIRPLPCLRRSAPFSRPSDTEKGATGFDWIAAGMGGVSWLISRPRKKPIKKQLPIGR